MYWSFSSTNLIYLLGIQQILLKFYDLSRLQHQIPENQFLLVLQIEEPLSKSFLRPHCCIHVLDLQKIIIRAIQSNISVSQGKNRRQHTNFVSIWKDFSVFGSTAGYQLLRLAWHIRFPAYTPLC